MLSEAKGKKRQLCVHIPASIHKKTPVPDRPQILDQIIGLGSERSSAVDWLKAAEGRHPEMDALLVL